MLNKYNWIYDLFGNPVRRGSFALGIQGEGSLVLFEIQSGGGGGLKNMPIHRKGGEGGMQIFSGITHWECAPYCLSSTALKSAISFFTLFKSAETCEEQSECWIFCCLTANVHCYVLFSCRMKNNCCELNGILNYLSWLVMKYFNYCIS